LLYGAASVEAKSMTMGETLGQRFPLVVPRFQRAYAWDEAVGDFVQDINAMLEYPAGQTSHFFGGVVCIQLTDNQKVRPTSYEVVDGQQRLATLILALSCVVKAASDLEDYCRPTNQIVANRAMTLKDDTRENFVTWKDSDVSAGTTTERIRMALSLADDTVFTALVLDKEVPELSRESHDLLIAAKTALMDMTETYVGATGPLNDRMDRLIRLRHALLQDAHVIHIVSQERSQAYRLFSVLNHRGVSLSDADLLRSRSLELLENVPAQHEAAAKIWDEMLGQSAKEIEAFFLAFYPSVAGKRAEGDLFEAIEKLFFPVPPPTTTANADGLVRVVERFRDELAVYTKLVNGDWPYDRLPGKPAKVRAWQIDRLRRLVLTLRHDLAIALLLSAARSLDEKVFADLVFMLEIFAFRYKIICGGHATRPSNLYNRQAKFMRDAIPEKPYSLKPFRVQLRELIADKAGETLFKQLLAEKLQYSNSSQRVNIKEFLTTLEDHRTWWLKTGSKQANAAPKPSMMKVIDIEGATLEHIYPQSAVDADRDPELEPLKHTLGNMTFFGADDNVAAGNKPFAAKRTANYKPSEIAMTSDLATKDAWTNNDVKSRQEELIDQAVRIFLV
jgi:hypothetical protein